MFFYRKFRFVLMSMCVAVLVLSVSKSASSLKIIDNRQNYVRKVEKESTTFNMGSYSKSSLAVLMSSYNFDEKMTAMKAELEQMDGFLGTYEYFSSQTVWKAEAINLDSTGENRNLIYSNDRNIFIFYEYNSSHEFYELIEAMEGVIFDTKPVIPGDDIPVVATKNSGLKIGDRLVLSLSLEDNDGTDAVTANAYVCGMTDNRVYMPYMPSDFFGNPTPETTQDPVFVFIPPLDEYRSLYSKTDVGIPTDTKNIYVVFEVMKFGIQQQIQINEIIYKYGIVDRTEHNRQSAANIRYEAVYLIPDIYDKSRSAIVFAIVAKGCVALYVFVFESISLIRKIRERQK